MKGSPESLPGSAETFAAIAVAACERSATPSVAQQHKIRRRNVASHASSPCLRHARVCLFESVSHRLGLGGGEPAGVVTAVASRRPCPCTAGPITHSRYSREPDAARTCAKMETRTFFFLCPLLAAFYDRKPSLKNGLVSEARAALGYYYCRCYRRRCRSFCSAPVGSSAARIPVDALSISKRRGCAQSCTQ